MPLSVINTSLSVRLSCERKIVPNTLQESLFDENDSGSLLDSAYQQTWKARVYQEHRPYENHRIGTGLWLQRHILLFYPKIGIFTLYAYFLVSHPFIIVRLALILKIPKKARRPAPPPPPVPPPSRSEMSYNDYVPAPQEEHIRSDYDFPPPPEPAYPQEYPKYPPSSPRNYRRDVSPPGVYRTQVQHHNVVRSEVNSREVATPNSEVVIPPVRGVGTLATQFEKQEWLSEFFSKFSKNELFCI